MCALWPTPQRMLSGTATPRGRKGPQIETGKLNKLREHVLQLTALFFLAQAKMSWRSLLTSQYSR